MATFKKSTDVDNPQYTPALDYWNWIKNLAYVLKLNLLKEKIDSKLRLLLEILSTESRFV